MRPRIRTGAKRVSGDVQIQCWLINGSASKVSYREAKKLVDAGSARFLFNQRQEIFGIKMLVVVRLKDESPGSISAKEMDRFAARDWADGGSRTINLTEKQRRERIAAGRAPEDHLELVITKINFYPLIGTDRATRTAYSAQAVEQARAFDRSLYYEGASQVGSC